MMYCPSCFNQSLHLNSNGVVEIKIDGKQLDSGRFLFSVEMKPHEVARALDKKIEEFMRWYGSFQNKEPLQKIQIITNAVGCTNGCKIPLNFQYNIVNDVITSEKVMDMLHKYAEKYKIEISGHINL